MNNNACCLFSTYCCCCSVCVCMQEEAGTSQFPRAGLKALFGIIPNRLLQNILQDQTAIRGEECTMVGRAYTAKHGIAYVCIADRMPMVLKW